MQKLSDSNIYSLIQNKTKNEIEAYLSSRGKSRVFEGARNLSLNVSDDYGERFLVELIQNAHDAHPKSVLDGEISVVFDPEDTEFGCLYVANKGNGFSAKNFEAITNVALSSKTVNEDIGNKGLGFRSVLQICQSPEIYSSLKSKNGFDGFCFRFADNDDILSFLSPTDSELADEILEYMPSLFLPVYQDKLPGHIPYFSEKGFVSVIRLPLTSEKSQVSVKQQMKEVLERDEPLNLFFERISKVTIEFKGSYCDELHHNVIDEWQINDHVCISKIKVADDYYLQAKYNLLKDEFQSVLKTSLEREEVPQAWNKWKGQASVNVAVKLESAAIKNGLLYCFLPLGEEGKSPFSGYINANFYTTMDRRSLISDVTLNKYFIEKSADLCCLMIKFLIQKNWRESQSAVVNLLCWQSPYRDIMHKALASGEEPLINNLLLPIANSGEEMEWGTLENIRQFGAENECLTSTFLSTASTASILCNRLDGKKIASLRTFFLGKHDFNPTPTELVKWIEDSAKFLLESNAEGSTWALFYDEVAEAMNGKAEALNGCRFLLSSNNELVCAQLSHGKNKKQTIDIYFPPVRTSNSDENELELAEFPDELQSSFTLLSNIVPWASKADSCRKAKAFLIEHDLVKEYDKRELLRTLARVTKVHEKSTVRQQALLWAFRLWGSGRSLGAKDTRSARFAVPTIGGWISAQDAMFGVGWTDANNGIKLDQYFKGAKGQSAEIEARAKNFIPQYKNWDFEVGRESDWFEFLYALGVRDHLRVFKHSQLSESATADWMPNALSNKLDLSDIAKSAWKDELQELTKKAWYNSVSYSAKCDIWLIPGLLELQDLSDEVRKLFSYQLIKALSDVSSVHLCFKVSRKGANIIELRSPLATYLKCFPWMPVAMRGSKPSFVAPQNAWLFNIDEETTPKFLKVIIPTISKLLEALNTAQYQKLLGFRGLNDHFYAQQAIDLALDSVEQGLIDDLSVKRFSSIFKVLWKNLLTTNADAGGMSRLLTYVGDTIKIADFTSVFNKQTCFYVDEDNPSKINLLKNLEIPFFDFDSKFSEESWRLIQPIAPTVMKKLSSEELYVVVDGNKINSDVQIQSLEDCFGSDFLDLLVLIAAHKGQRFFSATKAPLISLRTRAKQLGVVVARHIEVSIANKVCDLPDSLNSAVVTNFDNQTLLVVQSNKPLLSLDLLTGISEQFSHALEYPSLASAFEATFLRLSKENWQANSITQLSELYTRLVGVSSDNINDTLKEVRGDLETCLRFAHMLAIAIGHFEIVDELAQLVEHHESINEDEVVEALAPLARLLTIESYILFQKLSDLYSPQDLQEEFSIPLKDLNDAIAECDGYVKVSNEGRHKQQFDAFLMQRKGRLLDQIRQCFVTDFDANRPLNDYIILRKSVDEIKVNPEWFYVHDDLSDELLEAYLTSWLENKTEGLSHPVESLLSLERLREENHKLLQEFWKVIGPIISTWIQYTDEDVPEMVRNTWFTPLVSRSQVALRANNDGWLDFRLLSRENITNRLSLYDIWPNGKEALENLDAWGISEADIALKKKMLANEKAKVESQRNLITVQGQECSAEEESFLELYERVKTSFSDTRAFESAGKREAALRDVNKSLGRGTGNGGGRHMVNAKSEMSNEQKAAVGLMGEAFAYEWIRRHHQNITISSDCWVSGYRNHIFGGDNGNDSLGYDFIVKLKSFTYYYEVKGSQGDSGIFEMGPTEVVCAQKFVSDKQHKYRILYVSNVTDPENTKIELLPNPFSSSGSQKMKLIGSGSMKFSFHTVD
jgi:hypothetical protein